MMIANLDYLAPISTPEALQLTGSALAISRFSAIALGRSTFTSAVLRNFVQSTPDDSSAYSSVQVIAIASGGNAFAAAAASSLSAS